MRSLIETQKKHGFKPNKNSKNILIMGSLSALLAACGGGGNNQAGATKTKLVGGEKKIDMDDQIVIRANDGSTPQKGGAGEDIFLVVGAKSSQSYEISDIKDMKGLSVDLSGHISAEQINSNIVSDLEKGGSLDGAADGAALVTFGQVDLTNTELKALNKIIINDNLMIDASQVKKLQSEGLKEIMANQGAHLSFKDAAEAIEIDVSGIKLEGLSEIHVGDNVTVKFSAEQLQVLSQIDGSGTIANSEPEVAIDISVLTVAADINFAPVADLKIDGDLTQNSRLEADIVKLEDSDGVGDLSYQWYRDGVAIENATEVSYLLTQDDVNKKISYSVSYTDGDGKLETVKSKETSAIANVNDTPLGAISFDGLIQEGETILANLSAISDLDGLGTFSYQWYKDGVAINDATSADFELKNEDVGHQFKVVVTYEDQFGQTETISSADTEVVLLKPILDLSQQDDDKFVKVGGLIKHDRLGNKLQQLGDINGDGIDDFALSVKLNKNDIGNSTSKNKEAYIIYGNEDGIDSNLDLDSLDGSNGFKVKFSDKGQYGDFNILNLGDFNGDGNDDFAVTEYRTVTPSDVYLEGVNYVVYGKEGGLGSEITLDQGVADEVIKIKGDEAFTELGEGFNGGGDFNGDGYDDYLISMAKTPNGDAKPNVSLIFGGQTPNSFDQTYSQLPTNKVLNFTSTSPNKLEFSSLSLGGDINGDGFDDLALSADFKNGSNQNIGVNYVLFGSNQDLQSDFNTDNALNNLNGTNGFKIVIDNDGSQHVNISDIEGDFNGDGYDDILLSVVSGVDTASSIQKSFILFGKKVGFEEQYNLSDLDGTQGLVFSGSNNLSTADGVTFAGDINGDGLDDVLIGSWLDNGEHSKQGSVKVIYGQKNPLSANIDLNDLSSDLGYTMQLEGENQHLGRTVGKAGDVNHDGYDDILIGSSDGGTAQGNVHIIYGGEQYISKESANLRHDDQVDGTAGIDALIGGLGNDTLNGLAGDDSLKGGHGDDILNGGAGRDLLFGGGGSDTFVFKAGDSNVSAINDAGGDRLVNYDIIRDFDSNTASAHGDKIEIDGGGIIAADATVDGLNATIGMSNGVTLKSHKIENGIISFDSDDSFSAAVNIGSTQDVAAVVDYLQRQDLGDAGTSVVFTNGANSYLFVQGDDDGLDSSSNLILMDNIVFDQIVDNMQLGQNDLILV